MHEKESQLNQETVSPLQPIPSPYQPPAIFAPDTAAQTRELEAVRLKESEIKPHNEEAERKKAQEEKLAARKEARRLEKLQKDMEKQKAAASAPVAQPTAAATPTPQVQAPSTKEQKLADLLRKYKNDEITPQQYHTERARIIAEP